MTIRGGSITAAPTCGAPRPLLVTTMRSLLPRPRCGPIGVDIGSRSVKLMQFDATQSRVHAAARWDLPPEPANNPDRQDQRLVEAIRHASEGRNFRGRDAVLCLGAGNLFVQNIRVAQASGDELTKIVHFEAAGRLPFAHEQADVRYLEADDVKQGDTVRREVVLLACHRPAIDRMLSVAEQAGLRPVAVDVEPAAILRCYSHQFRRDDDQQRRIMILNIGASSTAVVIARGTDTIFVKYLEVGGRHFDEAVARHLKMTPADAVALRRHNGDRRGAGRDPEIVRGIDESVRPVLDKLAHELSLCLRYYSVTFRGQPLSQVVLGGGEANDALAEWLAARLDLPCGSGNPLRPFAHNGIAGRLGQWDVAAGLALRQVN
jgi:type IV pilus assembly protein PilM